jgi:hypothetical protein
MVAPALVEMKRVSASGWGLQRQERENRVETRAVFV